MFKYSGPVSIAQAIRNTGVTAWLRPSKSIAYSTAACTVSNLISVTTGALLQLQYGSFDIVITVTIVTDIIHGNSTILSLVLL